jgi:hypothetical protein
MDSHKHERKILNKIEDNGTFCYSLPDLTTSSTFNPASPPLSSCQQIQTGIICLAMRKLCYKSPGFLVPPVMVSPWKLWLHTWQELQTKGQRGEGNGTPLYPWSRLNLKRGKKSNPRALCR